MIEDGKDIYNMSPYEYPYDLEEEDDHAAAKKDWTYGIPSADKNSYEWYYHLKPYVAQEWKQKIVVPSKREKLDNKTDEIEVQAAQIIDKSIVASMKYDYGP